MSTTTQRPHNGLTYGDLRFEFVVEVVVVSSLQPPLVDISRIRQCNEAVLRNGYVTEQVRN